MIFEIIVVIYSFLFSVHIYVIASKETYNLLTKITFEIKFLLYKPYKRNKDLFCHNEQYFLLEIIYLLNLIFLECDCCRVKRQS